MNQRLASLVSGAKAVASACNPVLREYKVSYFKKTWNRDTKMYDSTWTVVEGIMAYSGLDAARKVDPILEPGRNCLVVRQIKEK